MFAWKAGQTPDQECPLEVVEVAVHGVIGEREALADRARIPLLTVHGREHAKQTPGGLRPRGQAPVGQIALRQQVQVVELPDGIAVPPQHAAVRVSAEEPAAPSLVFVPELGERKRRQLDERQPARQ